MNHELLVVLTTFAFYMSFEQGQYEASWRVHLFAILVPILLLKFVHDLDFRARLFIIVILAWHIIDVLNYAIDDGYKNDLDYKCIRTALTSNTETIGETKPNSSLIEKESMSSFSGQQTAGKNPPQDSISVSQSTDVQ